MPLIERGALLLLCGMMMTACATTATIATDRVACAAFSVITFSARDDSAETVRQVREHNARWRTICTD
jgi:hypothetical protein